MTSKSFATSCAVCMSTELLSILHPDERKKLQILTQLPIDSKYICSECHTLQELLSAQLEVLKCGTGTVEDLLKESRDKSDDNPGSPRGEKRKAS